MFWVDEITEDIIQKNPGRDRFIVRDEKTASGRVHVGSLRGVAIHAVIAQALRQHGKDAVFYYEINDMDPMDGLPVYVSKKYEDYMGRPLKDVPPPDAKGEPDNAAFEKDPKLNNYARHFGNEFIEVIRKLGFETEFIWASELYEKGLYNKWIEKVLASQEEIRAIYKEISGSEKPADWMPLQVVCEKCGKVGTTRVSEFDGTHAHYTCEPDMVEWAQGCGNKGKVEPWDGVGKVPWKVEWAVKWAAGVDGSGVQIEGSGKDHNAAGGSHEIAEQICKKILGAAVPYNIPYEFFLIGGAKMSASKGLGASAKEISDLLPPELLRFLMLRTEPRQPIDFKPEGDTIPRLFDNHDECALQYFEGEKAENPVIARAFYYAQLDPQKIQQRYFPRFSRMAFIVQLPHLDTLSEVEKLKGTPLSDADKKEAKERADYAKKWLDELAGDNAKFEVQKELPEEAKNLTSGQKDFLRSIVAMLKDHSDMSGEALHTKIHDLKNSSGLEPREAFGAIYSALLGKTSGPQAGWFLEALDRDFVIRRFENLA